FMGLILLSPSATSNTGFWHDLPNKYLVGCKCALTSFHSVC
ncbi:hypothetical protein HMPREF0496_3025, partial [Lentilactobacillus hilgardii ATCC 27305]